MKDPYSLFPSPLHPKEPISGSNYSEFSLTEMPFLLLTYLYTLTSFIKT